MKVLLDRAGHEINRTMTVEELRGFLKRYPESMPVFATWETVLRSIRPDDFDVTQVGEGHPSYTEPYLVIVDLSA